jgi:hypothetical protein
MGLPPTFICSVCESFHIFISSFLNSCGVTWSLWKEFWHIYETDSQVNYYFVHSNHYDTLCFYDRAQSLNEFKCLFYAFDPFIKKM